MKSQPNPAVDRSFQAHFPARRHDLQKLFASRDSHLFDEFATGVQLSDLVEYPGALLRFKPRQFDDGSAEIQVEHLNRVGVVYLFLFLRVEK